MIAWTDPLEFLHGLTTYDRRALKKLSVSNMGELLEILPRRYDDYTRLLPIAEIPTGVPVTVRGRIASIAKAPTFRKSFVMIKAKLEDESGSIGITWFNQPWLTSKLKPGDEIFVSGAVTIRPRMGRGFTSPLWEPANAETLAAGNVAPVYPSTGNIVQKTLRKIFRQAVNDVQFPNDWLPEKIRTRAGVVGIADAYRFVHTPSTLEEAERGRKRLAFDEFLEYQLGLRMAREESLAAGAPSVKFDESFAKTFVSALPFTMTPDQKKAVWSAVKDMESERPMRRLLQGDVGTGKTAVAAMLSALVFRAGSSAAVMAPTDLLAKQHAETFKRFLVPHQIPVLLYTSSTRYLYEGGEEMKLTPEKAKDRLKLGRIVAVGTHALLVKGQSPPDLALAVVDEQHRFGVAQRETLVVETRADGRSPHLLSMSATPIPRSLALTLFGDLDVSIIKTKPAGRLPIKTSLAIGESGREHAYDLIRTEVAAGRRAFIVCPLIEDDDEGGVRSVETETRKLSSGPLRGLRIAALHGRLSAKEKDSRMESLAAGELDVVVATTVVEVGVDVPTATVILIEGAERFGLAQLHQLRGRVGRSSLPSYCLLAPTDGVADMSLSRLRVLEQTNDGFAVAEADLKFRGEGNLLGTNQSGEAAFRAAKADDLALMADARELAQELLFDDLKTLPELRKRVMKLRESSHQE